MTLSPGGFVHDHRGCFRCRNGAGLFLPDPAATFTINGLGSCIALALYDPQTRVGGLCHIVLPESDGKETINEPAKFANRALPYALQQMIRMGAKPRHIIAKIAGGSHLFQNAYAPLLQIGERNIAAVTALLAQNGINFTARDVGGKSGRSITFRLLDARLEVRTLQGGIQIL